MVHFSGPLPWGGGPFLQAHVLVKGMPQLRSKTVFFTGYSKKEASASFSMFRARNRRLLVAGTVISSVLAISS